MDFWYGLLLGLTCGIAPGLILAMRIRRKLLLSRQIYRIAERIANSMEVRAKRSEEAVKIILDKYVRSNREEERLRSEKLRAWDVPDKM